MTSSRDRTLRDIADELVGRQRGILAADESVTTMSARLGGAGIEPTERNRRDYRELLVTTPDLHEGISGVILCDETLRQELSDGRSFPQGLSDLGLMTGIKVDTGARPLAGTSGELVTEGLDGLDARLAEYACLGARFAKWRAVLTVADTAPGLWALRANAHALARYARSCQDAGIVPVVEPELLARGTHSAGKCAAATSLALMTVTRALREADVDFAATVLKPNMILPGASSGRTSRPEEVARATVDVLRTTMPDALAGVAFLSGGQQPDQATANLAAMQRIDTPWPLTFSFGRALVTPALEAWRGDPSSVPEAQAALGHHVRRNSAVLRESRRLLRSA